MFSKSVSGVYMAAGLTLAVVFISGTREQEKSIWTAFYIPPPSPTHLLRNTALRCLFAGR